MSDAGVLATERDTLPNLAEEASRASERRRALAIERPFATGTGQWGLALSGGGIRSATFCLGVLQGLTKAGPPPSGSDAPLGKALLSQFDYVSTVSGGGFIGGFFTSLFVKGRLNADKALLDDALTAKQAYRVFAEEPPQRLRAQVRFTPDRPGLAALAWLRENGRYMAPNGAGDMLYAVATHIRNWCATHYVLGVSLLTLFVGLALVRAALLGLSDGSGGSGLLECLFRQERALFKAVETGPLGWDSIWWSVLWWPTLPILALWSMPAGIAYWFTQRQGGLKLSEAPERLSVAAQVSGWIAVALLSVGYAAEVNDAKWLSVSRAVGVAGLVTLVGFVWYVRTACKASSVAAHRVLLTRHLKNGLIALAALGLLALIDSAAQTIYVQWHSLWKLATPAAVVGALVLLGRSIAEAVSKKGSGGLLAKVPVSILGGVAGGVLALLVALVWALAVQWVRWNGDVPASGTFDSPTGFRDAAFVLGLTFAGGLLLSIATGRFPGFLNLSTLQGLYSARLTRAYLGASNSLRFKEGNEHLRSVAEPSREDHLDVASLYENRFAPMHIINVCMNQTSDPGENLVQRDRKGRPLALVPPGALWLDRQGHPMPRSEGRTEVAAALSLGDWIGVSGAAFTTGLGRGTSVGMSLLLGLANVRLGRWWPTGIKPPRPGIRDRGVRWLFRTQFYLASELLARFHGTRRDWQYLSDGGHFENTGVYELLRPDREVSLIVCCDCGADPDYTFEDLANLTRLARIDYGIELEVDTVAADDRNALGEVFGTFADFRDKSENGGKSGKCAILVRVSKRFNLDGDPLPDAWIIFLKPRILPTSAIDIRHYQATHPSFPQETTTDQFFDEAQWESYRRLGREVAMRVFLGPDEGRDAYVQAFATHLQLPTTAVPP